MEGIGVGSRQQIAGEFLLAPSVWCCACAWVWRYYTRCNSPLHTQIFLPFLLLTFLLFYHFFYSRAEIESYFFQFSISTLDSHSIRCNTSPDLNPLCVGFSLSLSNCHLPSPSLFSMPSLHLIYSLFSSLL